MRQAARDAQGRDRLAPQPSEVCTGATGRSIRPLPPCSERARHAPRGASGVPCDISVAIAEPRITPLVTVAHARQRTRFLVSIRQLVLRDGLDVGRCTMERVTRQAKPEQFASVSPSAALVGARLETGSVLPDDPELSQGRRGPPARERGLAPAGVSPDAETLGSCSSLQFEEVVAVVRVEKDPRVSARKPMQKQLLLEQDQ